MSAHLIFLTTQLTNPESALIRRFTLCSWSHVGFYRISDGWNFSAMQDGGVRWRGPNPAAPMLLLTHPHVDEIAQMAFTQEGKGYNAKEIMGIALGRNWSERECFDCDQLVFWAAIAAGHPLVNSTFIPIMHLTPRDVLLCKELTEVVPEKISTISSA